MPHLQFPESGPFKGDTGLAVWLVGGVFLTLRGLMMPKTRPDRKEARQLIALRGFQISLKRYEDDLKKWKNDKKNNYCKYIDYEASGNRINRKIAKSELQILILKKKLKLV